MSIPIFLVIRNPIVPIKMWMSLRYFQINDKKISKRFRSFFSRKFEKKKNSKIWRCSLCTMINSTLLMVSE